MPSAGFARPEALILLAAVAALAALAAWSEVRRGRALEAFAGRGAQLASVSIPAHRVKLGLAVASVALVVVALSGPYLDIVKRKVVQSGVDLVVALDVSQSMATRDVDPDRLRLGKSFIARLGDTLTQSRVSLIFFAGDGIVRYPATDDPTVLGRTLDATSPGLKPRGGSSLRSAVEAALLAFPEEARSSTRQKAVILVTDGEDITGEQPDLDQLRQHGVRLFTVGVGTTTGGAIPVYDTAGKFTGYLKRSNGEQIISHADESALRALADRTNGRYWHLTSAVQGANDVASELRRLDATVLGELEGSAVPDDRYQIPLGLAALALLSIGLIDERRGMPRPRWLPALPGARRRALVPGLLRAAAPWVLVIVLGGACGQLAASDADRMYLAGDPRGALQGYRALLREHPDTPELHVNAGNAQHQLEQYPAALDEYAIAIRDGAPHVRAVAQYQRGNTLFRMGRLDEAREAYTQALRIDPNDRDAKFNIELIDRVLHVVNAGGEEGAPQPGTSGQPGAGQGPQQSAAGQPQAGQPQAGQDAQPSGADQSGPGASGAPGQPQPGDQAARGGPQGPQTQGPPSSDGSGTGTTVTSALRAFRSNVTPEEALHLLDALQADQRGIEQLIEGPPQRAPGQTDPSY